KYLSYFFNSLDLREYISGTAQPKLNQSNLNRIPVPICGLAEQNQIVEEIEARLSIIEDLKKAITENLKRSEILKQIILKKAFSGKLTHPNDHSQFYDDLLEKINLEKQIFSNAQKELAKLKPKTNKLMEEKKSILQILNSSAEPISAKDVWLQSMYKDDIEAFYSELRDIQDKIIEVKQDTSSLLSLRP
ncbi:MAG: hypothetical protein EOO43_18535, partial [Flavobacterium sp.]